MLKRIFLQPRHRGASLSAAILVVSACVSSVPALPSEPGTRALSTVSAVLSLVDQKCFEQIEPLYAPMVATDYTSLWGGAPRSLTNAQVAEGWAGFLPGFDATHHRISQAQVETMDGNILVQVEIDAMHWLDGNYWWIAGTYRVELGRGPQDQWTITRWAFELSDERGDRGLVDEAEERAPQVEAACALRRVDADTTGSDGSVELGGK